MNQHRAQPAPAVARHFRRRGYALLVSLALVAISGAVLTSLARYSLAHAAEARATQRDLQVRWGTISIRDALLATASDRLAVITADAIKTHRQRLEDKQPSTLDIPRTLRMERWLGPVHFTAVVRDESARVNINALYESDRAADSLRRSLSHLTRQTGEPVEIRLAPSLAAESRRRAGVAGPALRPFNTFDQVFLASPLQLIGPDIDDNGLIRDLTLWSRGRINVQRATPDALLARLSRWLTESDIKKARSLWHQHPDNSFKALLIAAAPAAARPAVQDAVTETSDCYSVWVTATLPVPGSRSTTGPRKHLWAINQIDDDGPTSFEFTW